MIISKQRRSKKKEGEDDEYMFHKGSYWWFRRTQYIPRFGGVLQECGDFTWRVEVEGSQFFHETRLQFLLSL